jgi:DNA (cytosine-5)-methyltransferase 1
MNMMTFITLFAGADGAGLGLRSAGLQQVLAIDNEPTCLETIRANDPIVNLGADDLSQPLSGVLGRHGVSPDYPGVIWLSPPCQGASASGSHTGWLDPRNHLLFSVHDACVSFPRAWVVMEQVTGLLEVPESREVYEELLRRLVSTGRDVGTWILCALNLGLPQTRERLFHILPPQGVPAPACPAQRWTRRNWRKIPGYPTLRQLIHPSSGFEDPDPACAFLRDNERAVLSEVEGGNWRSSLGGSAYVWHLYARRLMPDKPRKGRKPRKAANPCVLPSFPYVGRRLSWDMPCGTIVASWPTLVGFRSAPAHPDGARYLSVGECQVIQGFPTNYWFCGTAEERMKQVGNAVPPPMARLVGEAVLAARACSC